MENSHYTFCHDVLNYLVLSTFGKFLLATVKLRIKKKPTYWRIISDRECKKMSKGLSEKVTTFCVDKQIHT